MELKKLLSIAIFIVAILFGFSACQNSSTGGNGNNSNPPTKPSGSDDGSDPVENPNGNNSNNNNNSDNNNSNNSNSDDDSNKDNTEVKPGTVKSITSGKLTKDLSYNNPLLPNFYCADPTAVEYEGRLYVYGSNDQQMYDNIPPAERGTKKEDYGYIDTLVVMSSADMANWTFHGEIKIKEIASWAVNA